MGNILGPNIFNIFFVLGVSPAIRPVPLSFECDMVDLAVSAGAALLLERWEGALFITAYGSYLAYVLLRR